MQHTLQCGCTFWSIDKVEGIGAKDLILPHTTQRGILFNHHLPRLLAQKPNNVEWTKEVLENWKHLNKMSLYQNADTNEFDIQIQKLLNKLPSNN